MDRRQLLSALAGAGVAGLAGCVSADSAPEAASTPATDALDDAEFVADRPFLFLIRHRPTGAPLFLGRMADATAAQ